MQTVDIVVFLKVGIYVFLVFFRCLYSKIVLTKNAVCSLFFALIWGLYVSLRTLIFKREGKKS